MMPGIREERLPIEHAIEGRRSLCPGIREEILPIEHDIEGRRSRCQESGRRDCQ